MRYLFHWLIIQGFEDAAAKIVFLWVKFSNIEKLIFCLNYSNARIRQLAARGLGGIKGPTTLVFLLKAINDPVEFVSLEAIAVIENLKIENKELTQLLENKRVAWREVKLAIRKHNRSRRSIGTYDWERPSKKSLDLLREQLKKPICSFSGF